MDKLKYSIIYAIIRPEISEQISLGLILVNNGQVKIRYSKKKLHALKGFYSASEYNFLSKTVRSLKDTALHTEENINYLTRYLGRPDINPIVSVCIPTYQQHDYIKVHCG